MSISKNILSIGEEIKKHSPYPEKVTLVAVTKYNECCDIEKVIDSGIINLGENRVQILTKKHDILWDKYKDINWHFIGNLQKNKVKYIAPFISAIHSVNKLSLAKEIDKRAKENNRSIDVFIEINLFEEDSKEGYNLNEFLKDIPELLKLNNIKIIGLMSMAPFTDNTEYIRNGFRKLRILKDELNVKYFSNSLTELSMGMSNDYLIALEEGATFIRVGTKIFK